MAYQNGPDKSPLWFMAKGSEWAPPQKGWFDKDRPRKEMRLSKVEDETHNDPNKRIVGGHVFDANAFLPAEMQH